MEEGKLIKENNFYMLEVQHERVGNMIIASSDHDFSKIINHRFKLSTKNCQSIENGYDLMKLAEENSHKYYDVKTTDWHCNYNGFFSGFQKALEILNNKKFSESDVRKAIDIAWRNEDSNKIDIIQSLQQTEWDVEIEMDFAIYPANLPKEGEERPTMTPKLDADGCLILKPRQPLIDTNGNVILKSR